ncbi:MAG: hypothetical protein D6701_08135 [Gemmatimonadetes bacterium]|nr:MAG: hypothetical protein D6701_08135 [Gemmatimonadota bacterium]
MDIDLALIADAATVDATGKLNILGVFDRITAQEFPTQHGRLALVLRFRAAVVEIGLHEIAIELRDPEGQALLRLDGQLELGGGAKASETGIRVPHVLNLDGLVFARPGRYAFDVIIDGEHHVSLPLVVDGVPQGGAAA